MIKYFESKHILQTNKTLDWFGAEYCANLYRGCSHGCIYCDSRSSCYQDFEFDIIKPKRNAISILEDELSRKPLILGQGLFIHILELHYVIISENIIIVS